MKSILFLDIDGVLNYDGHLAGRTGTEDQICPKAAARVQMICDATGAQIVVSSTWRLFHKKPKLQRLLGLRGITTPIIGVTPDLCGRPRGNEIASWLELWENSHPGDLGHICIIDDDDDACEVEAKDVYKYRKMSDYRRLGMPILAPWFVHTSFQTGLTDADAASAIQILQEPAPTLPIEQ